MVGPKNSVLRRTATRICHIIDGIYSRLIIHYPTSMVLPSRHIVVLFAIGQRTDDAEAACAYARRQRATGNPQRYSKRSIGLTASPL